MASRPRLDITTAYAAKRCLTAGRTSSPSTSPASRRCLPHLRTRLVDHRTHQQPEDQLARAGTGGIDRTDDDVARSKAARRIGAVIENASNACPPCSVTPTTSTWSSLRKRLQLQASQVRPST